MEVANKLPSNIHIRLDEKEFTTSGDRGLSQVGVVEGKLQVQAG